MKYGMEAASAASTKLFLMSYAVFVDALKTFNSTVLNLCRN